jgi:hypothetical protein
MALIGDSDRHDHHLGHARDQNDLRPDMTGTAVLKPGVRIAAQQRPFHAHGNDREQPADDGDRREAEDVPHGMDPPALRARAQKNPANGEHHEQQGKRRPPDGAPLHTDATTGSEPPD